MSTEPLSQRARRTGEGPRLTLVRGLNQRKSPELPLVSVVIPVRNDAARLRRCLASVAESAYPASKIEVIVADNGSTDESPNVATEMGATLLQFPDMRVAEVRNRAAKAASGDILVFVDADHELDSAWIPLAVEDLRTSVAGAVGAAYYAPSDGTWVQKMYDSFRRRTPGLRRVDWLGSGSLAVWRSVFQRVGGFDERLETCEDVDFCQRLRRGQHVLYSDDRLRSVHLGDPRTLRALFFGELWRGRDNLRVSLRGPLTWRAVPSVLIPITILTLLATALVAPFTGQHPVRVLLMVAGAILLLAFIRVIRMLVHIRSLHPLVLARGIVVAVVYEVARALALIARASHGVRQGASLSGRFAQRKQS
jgi:hypothetical protein